MYSEKMTAQGLLLQIADVFLPELGKVDNTVSLQTLATLLKPFLITLATTDKAAVSERIVE